ncbi:helix-hairpin-helix domain-containing protein [Baaleninema simplex]|uniref:helix-hairpin-helix domain-containing protein n=1 Tax=Baaleninema simplex TaxID=2862350 RepID=UPI00034B05AC|nr:helix-hairpin-helix domain-containing protein [Baaleninema simplex]
MSQHSPFGKVPQWVWWSFVPALGGLAIVYAGSKAKVNKWMYVGAGFTLFSFILAESELVSLLWIGQIVTSFFLKNDYLVKMGMQEPVLSGESNKFRQLALSGQKIDINNCSKDDLVRGLGLPIVYANDIETLRSEGYLFTHIEELNEIIGIPTETLQKIEPFVTFGYYPTQEEEASWRRVNTYSVEELMVAGLDRNVALTIVRERQKGEFKSVMDLKRRTKLPLKTFQHLM